MKVNYNFDIQIEHKLNEYVKISIDLVKENEKIEMFSDKLYLNKEGEEQ